jgi:hypothetical protein
MNITEVLPRAFPRNQWVDKGSPVFLASCHLDMGKNKLGMHVGDTSFYLLKDLCLAYKVIWEEAQRRGLGPLVINSAYRSASRQAVLWAGALRKYGSYEKARQHVAPPGSSPHNYGAAFDIIVPRGISQTDFAVMILQVLGRNVRVGYRAYAGQGFVHIDLCHLLINPKTGLPPDPKNHKAGVTW